MADPRCVGGLVLVIHPELATRDMLRRALDEDGYCVEVVASAADASTLGFDVIVADIRTGVTEALALRRRGTEVVLLTERGQLDEARAAIRRGAFDFVLRPFFADDVSLTVACAVARGRGRTLDDPLYFIRKNHELVD